MVHSTASAIIAAPVECPGMYFTVRRADGNEQFTGASRYTLDEHGHLVVYTDDVQRRTYFASGWRCLDEGSRSD